ncbi:MULTISPECIES: tetratricopeptide repeat protein [Maribacter]|uniref:Tetratricopeptide repeat protein n=1 Tax=Maribacter flavus TaxID=1658664 RepID=A0ABU7IJ70_9FLAO|nr:MULTISPECIES: tetratricopeptide repeat protein [Maribacter]MDC6405601.1 tetratricopeptide repeat protein [Maribacter sp. PR66]MEE1972631.1 tetratricopeptide repeat protein [Maribacter flavus]
MKLDSLAFEAQILRYQESVENNLEEAKLIVDSLMLNAIKQKEIYFEAKAYQLFGHYFYLKSDFQNSIDNCKKALNLLEQLKMEDPMPNTLNQLGISQRYLGQYDEALKSHQIAAQLNEKIEGDPIDLARSYLNMGNLMFDVKNLEASNKYYQQSEEICIKYGLNDFIPKCWGNLAANYRYEGHYEKALEYHYKSITHFEKNPSIALTREYNNIGAVFDDMENFGKAKSYYSLALQHSEKYGEPQLKGLILRNLGEMAMVEKNYNQAEEYMQQAMVIANSTGNIERLIRSYGKMAEIKAATNNFKSAYEYRTKYNQLYDSLKGVEVTERINNLEIKYQTEKKEAEIALQQEEIKTLSQEVEISNLKKGLYAGGMASALTVSGLLFFGFRQRIKKNKIEREKQEAIYQQEIEHKQKELASQTLHLVQKNTFIQELMENLENIKNSPEKFKMEFRRIVMLLKKENASDKDWEVFKSYFAEVHNDFDQKLKTIYPDISEKEIRLAAFLRMNLTTKEIAATLNVLPDSILKSKYRLKKKLGLDKETDLNQFLNTL